MEINNAMISMALEILQSRSCTKPSIWRSLCQDRKADEKMMMMMIMMMVMMTMTMTTTTDD